jgi:hypothetical protein
LALLAASLFFPLSLAAQRPAKPRSRITGVIDDARTVSRPLDIHPLARKEYDQGEVPPDTRLDRMVLVLTRDAAQQKELDGLLAAQQDRASPEYRRWLTPAAFGARFGVSDADLAQIVDCLHIHEAGP